MAESITRGRFRFIRRDDGAVVVTTTSGNPQDVALPNDRDVTGRTLDEFATEWLDRWH